MKSFLFLSFLLYSFYGNATVFNVSNTNDDGTGSLRQAIIDANADAAEPHVINISIAGTIILQSNLPAITRSLTINGNPFGGTAVSGNNAYTIFNFTGTSINRLNVFINDLELMYAYISNPITGEGGSAIHASNIGTMAIERCYIHHCNNVVNAGSSYLSVRGGAIYVFGTGGCSTSSIFYMRQTTVAYNLLSGTNPTGYVEAFGAGLYTQTFNDTIENCTFYGNKAFASSGESTSQANATGGGLAFYGCSISVNHSSFVSDTAYAENTAGGLHTSGAAGLTTIKYPIHLSNSLADLNIADHSVDIGTLNSGLADIISEGNNVIGDRGGVWPSQQVSDSVNQPSGVQPLSNNGGVVPTCALPSNRIAVDKVLTGILLNVDGRNYSRDNKPDAGAYELNGISLPLQLINFSASICNKQVCLQWNTANEINTKNFVVQRSKDGINFTNMVIVNASGNKVQTYTAVDIQPLNGINYYRLQMNDMDGKYTYSNVVGINFSDVLKAIIFPNPAQNYFAILNAHGIKNITLIQNDGRIIKHWQYQADNRYNISNILPGFYSVKIETIDGITSQKLYILK